MTDEDQRTYSALRAMWQHVDPVPPHLPDAMVAAVAAAGLDEELELLVLVHDSADDPAPAVRGLATARSLSFRNPHGWTMEVEVDHTHVRGQLLDCTDDLTSATVTIDGLDGAQWSATLDEFGFFSIPATVNGAIRVTVALPTATSRGPWVELQPPQ